MSTAPPPVPVTTKARMPEEVRIYQHSSLMYWWPVWAIGYIMAALTYFDGSRAAILPSGTEAYRNPQVTVYVGKDSIKDRDVLVLPQGQHLPDKPNKKDDPLEPKDYMHMSSSKNLGVVYALALLLTIVITSVSVRGVWSIVVIVSLVLIVVLFALFDIWGTIADMFALLRIHINVGGYFFLSTVLLIIWAVTVLLFDRRTYVIFAPGQVRVLEAVGAGEKMFDTTSMVLHKLQNNFFQHWIWGVGSGDLEIITSKGEKFEWHNVAFIGQKIRKIEELIKMKEVV